MLEIHWYDHITNKEVRTLSHITALFGHVARLDESTAVDVSLNFQIFPGVIPASSGQINFGIPSTTHLEIYEGVLFVVEQYDSSHWLRDS